MMNDLIGQGYDAIILQPIDTAALDDRVKKAEAKGIHVITLNTNIAHAHAAHVTMDDFGAGSLVGGIIGKGNVAIIQPPPGALAGVGREKGFREALSKQCPEIKIVGAQNGEWRKEKAAEIMMGFLLTHPQLDAVFAVNDNLAEGTMMAAESAGRLEKTRIWSFNGDSHAVPAFAATGETVRQIETIDRW